VVGSLSVGIACSTQSVDRLDHSVVEVPDPGSSPVLARRIPRIETSLLRPVSRPIEPMVETFFWLNRTPATNPGIRDSHAMAYDAASGNTVLFSGDVCNTSCAMAPNDTWTWNGTNWTKQNPATSPQARYWAAMTFDSTRHVNVLYGGVAASGDDFSDTWEWNGSNWTQMSPAIRSRSPTTACGRSSSSSAVRSATTRLAPR
jgi:hypothetical protein